jgi:hypothetical protein
MGCRGLLKGGAWKVWKEITDSYFMELISRSMFLPSKGSIHITGSWESPKSSIPAFVEQVF